MPARFVSTALLALTLALPLAAAPTVFLGPPGNTIQDLFDHPDQWSQTRGQITGLMTTPNHLKTFSDDQLRGWFAQMRQWHLGLQLEVGAIKEWAHTGAAAFTKQKVMFDRALALGAPLESLAMDEPLCCTRRNHLMDQAAAARETADFIAHVRAAYPNLRVGEVEPYPFMSLAEHLAWIKDLQAALAARQVRGLDFYRLDVDYMNFLLGGHGGWTDVHHLEQACRAQHLPFSLIYWAAGYPLMERAHLPIEPVWHLGVMSEAYVYAAIGGKPDDIALESWVKGPPRTVPDSDPLTFTGTARDFLQTFVNPPASAP